MLFAEADAPHLRNWIIKRLENTSDADADVLADYVIALLRHDGDAGAIRNLFEEEIPDFLRDDSAAFTDDVFQAIKYKSYLPGAPPAPPIIRQAPAPIPLTHQIPSGPAASQQGAYPPFGVQHTPYAETPSAFSTHNFRNGSKKRSYRDLDAPDSQPMNWDYGGGTAEHQQPYKQARRGGGFVPRGGRFDDPYAQGGRGGYGHNAFNSQPPPNGPAIAYQGVGYGNHGPGYNPQQPFAPPQPALDANTILENIRVLQEMGAQMGLQMLQTDLPKPIYSGQALSMPHSHQKRRPCRDYEKKGYCSRGDRCQFEHGNSAAYVPAFQPPSNDEYDPNNATLGMPEHSAQSVKPTDLSTTQMPPFNRREPKKPKRKGGRLPFSAEGPNSDKTNTKIVVENIPEENFTDESIRGFFAGFGAIKEVELRPSPGSQKRVAIVEFEDWAAANAAWKSPKVVFDNRFVKVYWFKIESQPDPKRSNGARNGSASGDGTPAGPDFDMEEFKHKQEEAQKTHLEKQQKREELARQQQELEDKRRELVARQQEAKRELQAKLAANGIKEDSLSPVLTKATPVGEQPSQAETLRAKLAALEEEANSLGIDPDAAEDTSYWAARGRGRGRGPYRGRGGFQPRVARGGYGYRGRGGGATQDVHAAYAAYSLDNRPKVVVISGVDFTDPVKDEALKQYLFGIGEFTDVTTEPAATYVTFKDRKTAEQFTFGVSGQKTIPGVEGEVELSWATSAPKTARADNDFPTVSGPEEDQAVQTGQDEQGYNQLGHMGRSNQDDMDYEGGDWDIS
ncbi:hypothetical protein BKA67DRAFT_10157 [Truncatella angustata]|uniref:Uncharacterized protein n=1 Tax=Truncatella angustata TaxID=152316 RepID=A0A9P9A1A4_9PEZI|nr:uncharacterized protein BKA67DRAFT_10157 [Truncatella angustata]KAH6659296.1 hypothetical protein BKA67DRAFT_10157 [Truncatella angustata]KAH8198831.1 hypothetical protein TruAng_006999 [Truncatella angustata]